jgi:hypothetical protein
MCHPGTQAILRWLDIGIDEAGAGVEQDDTLALAYPALCAQLPRRWE